MAFTETNTILLWQHYKGLLDEVDETVEKGRRIDALLALSSLYEYMLHFIILTFNVKLACGGIICIILLCTDSV
jgi:hypothetical protein